MKITKEEIRAARAKLGMTQEEFGNKLSMSGSSVSMLEKGLTSPIEITEGDPMQHAWKAMLTGDKEIIDGLPNPLSAWLKRSRERNGFSIQCLSDKSGVPEHTIKAIERGESPTRKEVISKLEISLGEPAPVNPPNLAQESTFPGIGTLEDFNPHNIDERPPLPGIYVFYDISDRPIYVGESNNIKKRIKQHEEKFWFKAPLVEYAAYIKIEDEGLRKNIEQILINFLRSNAVLNKQHTNRS